MPRLAILFGTALILLGATAYFGTGRASVTALIPAFFGLPLAVLGAVAQRPAARRHAMHAAAALALIGAAATIMPLTKAGKFLAQGENLRVVAVAGMAALCVAFVVLCVRSFVLARRMTAPT